MAGTHVEIDSLPTLDLDRASMDDMSPRLAVIDIGSNSGRVVIMEAGEDGALDIVDEMRAPLRLTSAMDTENRLSAKAFETVLAAVGDFLAVAHGQGVRDVRAVGTFAMREAQNGRVLAQLVRDRFGVAVEVIDGATEARYGFAGAVYGIDATHGLCVDIGGGSLQITRFDDRRPDRLWTFPFGALRLTAGFLATDPPRNAELAALRDHVRDALREAGVPALAEGEVLVGTGGTIRNLAKVDMRSRTYPIRRLHGYELGRAGLRQSLEALSSMPASERGAVPGLTSNRTDSIVAGAAALDAVMAVTGAGSITVAGQGLREGVIRGAAQDRLPPATVVRGSSIRGLGRRFSRWSAPRARRRARTALALLDALAPDAEPALREAVGHAAQVIDVGATIDVYNRHERSAEVVLGSDLQGFSHRLLVLVAAVLRLAERPGTSLKGYRPILDEVTLPLEAAGTVLALADEIERRWPDGDGGEVGVTAADGVLHVVAPVSSWWRPDDIAARVRASFGQDLLIEGVD